MSSSLQKSRFLRGQGWSVMGKAARVAASLGLAFTMISPLPAAQTAQAKDLEWGYVRPPLTDEADTVDTNGFTALSEYGDVAHAITVAPNGDVFTAGATGAGAVNMYRSTDGGLKWRETDLPGVGANALVRKIVVSPDYPSDDFVGIVFTDGTVAGAQNGFCWSTDAGLTFPGGQCLTAAAAAAPFNTIALRTAALSPDFNWNDGNGEIAIGGTWAAGTGTVAIATTTALKNTPAAADFVTVGETTAAAADAATDVTLDLSYTYDEEPIALARLFVLSGANTFGQVKSGATWGAVADGGSDEINDDDTTNFAATSGTIAFDDEYSNGGSFFAAAGAGGTTGGVFRFNGSTWTERTLNDACDTSIDSLTLAGNGSSTRMVASATASNMVCRSTNEGSSWSDTNADGGDSVCDVCRITATGAVTRVANNRKNPETSYWTTSGNFGGVAKSTNSGSSWADTGLTNDAYTITAFGMVEVDNSKVFAHVENGAGEDAVFWTDNYGTAAGWQRVLRTSRTDFGLSVPSDFGTTGTAWGRFTGLTSDNVLRSTDGGRTWDNTSSDPFENGPENNETPVQASARSATTFYVGGDKGHVAVTTDGGNSWTILAKDFGEDIDEFDFTSDATTFFVTGEDSDSINKVWVTRDSGATFTQVGDAPWGTGDGAITTNITAYKPADNSGYVLVTTGAGTSNTDVYRIKIGDSTWTDMDIDNIAWTSMLMTSAPGIGDGFMTVLWDNAADELYISFNIFTGDPKYFDPDDAADAERDNNLLALPIPAGGAGSLDTGRNANGYTLQNATAGQVQEMTLTAPFRGGVSLTQPANNTSVGTNVGDNGTPVVFRWNDVSGADSYEVMVGLDPTLKDGTIVGGAAVTTNLIVVDDATAPAFPLVQGNTYYWAVRVKAAEGATFEGPWSAIQSFSVASQGAPTSPQPQLPLDGSTMPNLGPTQLSWNNPAGTVQFHIQVLPLNNDGPAIDLIIGDPDMVRSQSFTVLPPVMGQGNYIILPGSTYNWRVRTTTLSGSIGVNDASWGPWSDIRTYKTPRPSAASIQVMAPSPECAATVCWKDSNTSNFYYEVQVSTDRTFNADPATATAAVYWNLVHGGLSNPLNSWSLPSGTSLESGKTYYARVRQRVQATPLGADEPGIGWSTTISFVAP